MLDFPLPELPVAQRHLFAFVLKDVKGLRRLGEERDVDERRCRREESAAAFDADIEKNVGSRREDEIGGEAEDPKRGPLEDSTPLPMGPIRHIGPIRCSSETAPRTSAPGN